MLAFLPILTLSLDVFMKTKATLELADLKTIAAAAEAEAL